MDAEPSVTNARLYIPVDTAMDEEEDWDKPVDPGFLSFIEDELGDAGMSTGYYGSSDAVDFYSVLGVSRDASSSEIRASYKRLSKLLHPDKHFAMSTSNDSVQAADAQNIRLNAQAAFGKISAAYAVLSDANKRAIYDKYGHRGLNLEGWELALREKSTAELQLEYLKLRAKEREERQLRYTQPTSEFSLGIDMTDIFDRYLKEEPIDRLIAPSLSVYEMVLRQSITVGATLRTSISLVGEVVAQNGLGVGTWLLLCQHRLPPTSFLGPGTLDTELSYGRGGKGMGLGLRYGRNFSDRFSCYFGLHILRCRLIGNTLTFRPGLGAGVSTQLTPHCRATAQLSGLVNGGLSAELSWASPSGSLDARLGGYIRPTGKYGIQVNLEKILSTSWLAEPLSAPIYDQEASEAEFKYRKDHPPPNPVDEDKDFFEDNGPRNPSDKRGRLSFMLGLNTEDIVTFGTGLTSPISVYSRLTGFISISLTRGVTFRLLLQRGQQSYALPILLSLEADPVAFGYGFLVPLLAFAAIRSLVYEPWLLKQLERAQAIRRQRLRDELFRRRQQALATQSLMKFAAERQAHSESSVNGLLINKAVFGCLLASTSSHGVGVVSTVAKAASKVDLSGQICVDVSIPLQAMVESSQLILPPGRWSDLQGFYDPCLGLRVIPSSLFGPIPNRSLVRPTQFNVSRQLFVQYQFRSELHEVFVDETQGLAIPMAKHKILSS